MFRLRQSHRQFDVRSVLLLLNTFKTRLKSARRRIAGAEVNQTMQQHGL